MAAAAAAAAAATSGDVATIARMATAPPAVQPLEQLGTTTPPAAARESASPAYTTTSGRTSGSPAARNVSAMRQGGTFPRRLRDYNARPSATFKYGTSFRSPCRTVRYRSPSRTAVQYRSCRTVRHSPPSYLDITRQRYSIDPFSLRTSVKSSQFCTSLADATAAAHICRVATSTGASFRFWLELLFRAIPSSTGTIRASRRIFEFGFD